MSKIYFQGTFGAYSHLAALSIEPKAEIIPCKTFDECFSKASKDTSSKIIIPESNRITGNIGIEYLIFEYRLNIYSEYFQRIEHNLLCLPGTKISEIENLIKSETDKVTPLREKNIENLSKIQRLNLELQSLDEENTRVQDEIKNIIQILVISFIA